MFDRSVGIAALARAGRDEHLDGLRGLAALAVVIEHASVLFPVGEWHVGSGFGGDLLSSLINFPLRAGSFSVYVFFVLSGLVLSGAAQGKPWPASLATRYWRLTIPMLVASIIAWSLVLAFPTALVEISSFRRNYWTTNLYQNGVQPFWLAITEPLFGAYSYEDRPQLNPVLWSMRIELWGSLGVFTFYRLAPKTWTVPALNTVAAALLFSGLWSSLGFVVGMALYEWRIRSSVRVGRGRGVTIALLGIALGSLASLAALRYYSHVVGGIVWFEADFKVLGNVVGATFVVLGVFASKTGRNLMTSALPQLFGRISYSLYLTSMPLLYTAFAALYLKLGRPPAVALGLLWAVIYLAAAVALAYAMTVYIDEPVVVFMRFAARRSRRLESVAATSR
jgi:peptidoglycan/LPS O-acetylase OafA/YrhL